MPILTVNTLLTKYSYTNSIRIVLWSLVYSHLEPDSIDVRNDFSSIYQYLAALPYFNIDSM